MSNAAPSEKIYTQAELDQAIKEAGFATEDHRAMLKSAATAIETAARINGHTRIGKLWLAAYKAWIA